MTDPKPDILKTAAPRKKRHVMQARLIKTEPYKVDANGQPVISPASLAAWKAATRLLFDVADRMQEAELARCACETQGAGVAPIAADCQERAAPPPRNGGRREDTP